MSGFKFKIQIQSNPAFYTKDIKRILQFAPRKSQSRSRRCVLAHHRCVINQQLKLLKSRIGFSAVARANEARGHHPKVGDTKNRLWKLIFRSCTATIMCNFKIRPPPFLSSFCPWLIISRKIYLHFTAVNATKRVTRISLREVNQK